MEDPDVPQRVLDVIKMFLAASKRGHNTVLILESRKQQIITKYRSVEKVAGPPATTSPPTSTASSMKKEPSQG